MKFTLILFTAMVLLASCGKQIETKTEDHRHQSTEKTENVVGKDLVCSMDVSDTTIQTTHESKKYYFCAQRCKEEFEKDPQKYLTSNENH